MPSPDTTAQEPEPLGGFSLTPAGDLGLRGRGLPPAERSRVLDELFFEGTRWRPFVARFAVLIVLSTVIAGLGLMSDSAAVTIGAMLVAPLMTPILAVAAALVQGWSKRFWVSVAVVVGGAAGSVLTGYLTSVVFHPAIEGVQLPGELLARTRPTLLDLAIAIAAGAAGAYVTMRKEASSALPGVGIAVALIPPLATVGICFEIGRSDLAEGALLLFSTNLACIVFAAAVTFLVTGFVPSIDLRRDRRRRLVGLGVSALLVLAVAVPLGVYTKGQVDDQTLQREVVDAVSAWDPNQEIAAIEADVVGGRAVVELTVVGEVEPLPAWRLANLLEEKRGSPVEITLYWEQRQRQEAVAA